MGSTWCSDCKRAKRFLGDQQVEYKWVDVEMISAADVASITEHGHDRVVRTEEGAEYRAHAVILAPGNAYRRLGAEGEDDLIGAGIHYCATCDGPFYRGKDIVVIGGGNS